MKTDLNEYFRKYRPEGDYALTPRIHCADGLSLSVQAGCAAYCAPRNATGPWYMVEVGYPSAECPELCQWIANPEKPTDTVYGYVPISVVEKLIESHGGIVETPTGKERGVSGKHTLGSFLADLLAKEEQSLRIRRDAAKCWSEGTDDEWEASCALTGDKVPSKAERDECAARETRIAGKVSQRVEELKCYIAAYALLLDALLAQEEAERAEEAYRREEKAPLCGLAAEDHDAWKLRLSDLAQDAFELTAKAKQLRAAALAATNPASDES
jgi:hypothetical protein